jgi:hypothetical protein
MGYESEAGVQFQAEARNFALLYGFQTSPEAHPAAYPMGTGGSFPRDKAAGA